MRSGHGVCTYADGKIYTGDWTNNKRNGQGTLKYPKGKTRAGNWVNDVY